MDRSLPAVTFALSTQRALPSLPIYQYYIVFLFFLSSTNTLFLRHAHLPLYLSHLKLLHTNSFPSTLSSLLHTEI